ncbi:MAG: cytochrome c maturation protein CcmE [Chloroflexi bacterium]|nr:cytochrome c maturation protein CcmE [Chloroflexota bacterium]
MTGNALQPMPAAPTGPPRPKPHRRWRLLIVGGIVLLALGFLGFKAFQGAAMFYYTVPEFRASPEYTTGEQVRVGGKVAPGSVERHQSGPGLSFAVTDGSDKLLVHFYDIVPDSFAVDQDVVVEGTMSAEGYFAAQNLMVKCPSKYVPRVG